MTTATPIRDRVKELRRVRAGDLLAHPQNPRQHPSHQAAAVRRLLEGVGYAAALIAREEEGGTLRLIDGHLRADLTPDSVVPVLVTDLTEAEAAVILRELDRVTGFATVDETLLASLSADIDRFVDQGLVPTSVLLDDLLLPQIPAPPALLTDPDEIPQSAPSRCKSGELWELGAHRLAVGDCTDAEMVHRLMNGECAKLLVTDPPYAVDYVDKARDMNARGYVHSRATLGAAIQGDGIEGGQEEDLWRDAFLAGYVAALEESAAVYVWFAGQRTTKIHVLMADLGILHHQHMVWAKPNFVIGRCDYQWKHELCFYGWKQGHRPPFYGSRAQTTVWDVARDTQHPDHPTQKPVALFEPPMRNHLKPGEIAYDPFAGSGTALIAAESVGVRAYCCEVSPRHADTCLTRFERATGKTARRLP